MKLKSITKEEIETMSYDDLAYIILKEKGKKMKIAEIWRTVCELLELGDDIYEERIADFFTLLATEKRFLQLDKGYWDLRENHTAKIEIDEVDDEELEDEEEIEEEPEEDEMFLDETKEVDDDETEDELKDLVVLDDENEADL